MARQVKFPEGIKAGITVGQIVDIVSQSYPDKEAIVAGSYRKTWKILQEDIDKIAIGLLNLGLRKGDRACIWSKNNYQWIVSWFALVKAGAIIVPLDHWYKKAEAEYILSHSGARFVLCTEDFIPILESMKLEPVQIIIFNEKPSIVNRNNHIFDFWKIINAKITEEDREKLNQAIKSQNPDDVTFILYTSGTTGNPKGAMLTHNNIIRNMMKLAEILKADENDVYIVPVPFSHCFGCELGITISALTASKLVPLLDQDPKIAMETVQKEGGTILHGTPTHFIRYVREIKENPNKYKITTLRTGVTAGAPCPKEVMEDIINVLKMPDIVNSYGQTEASPLITSTTPEDPSDKRVETVGRAFEGLEVKIVDDDNHEVPIGSTGELCCRGWAVMKGYYRSPEMTALAIDSDGFLHTGDLATVDNEGYYRIVGRKKDMIIYGGANVYPKMIEDYLLTNPNILECAVVGIPDPEYGEVVGCVAQVKAGYTEQALVDFCYGQINDFAVPRFVRFDIPLPLSGRGKIQKYKLREILSQMRKEGKLGDPIVPSAIKEKKKKMAEKNQIKKYNREFGKELVEKYLKDCNQKLLASDLSLVEHAELCANRCYQLAIRIIEKNPEFKDALDPELLGFLGYVHNIGYAIQADKHELHTVYILVNKEGFPQSIAEQTKHGHLVEKHPESHEYYPLGLEGIILTYVDIMVSKNPNISLDERVKEVNDYVSKSSLSEEKKEDFLRNFNAAVPRYRRYESIIKGLL